MSAPGTKQKLLSLIEDVEIVTKELLDFLTTPKQNKADGINTSQLVDLLVQKDKEIQETVATAEQQVELQKKYDALKVEVDKRNQDIKQLQKNLKEAESILATAIYQAKKKLKSINQAKTRKICSEELIKYAHKISASNAVAAPPTWAPGDHRRPYPTDMDMRMGLLGRCSDLPNNHPAFQSQSSYPGPEGISRSQSLEHGIPSAAQPTTGTSSLQWSMELQTPTGTNTSLTSHTSIDSKSHSKENEDVELMSSDSSSSSSSDE